MPHRNEYIFEVNGSFYLLEDGISDNLNHSDEVYREKAAVKALSEMADQIEDDISHEIKKVLPQEVIVQSHIRFHVSSVGLEAFIEIIDWMGKLAGTIDFVAMAVKLIRYTVEKAVKKSAKSKAIPINPNKFEIFVYPVNSPNELEGTNTLLRELIKSQNAQARNQIEILDKLPLLRRMQQESELKLQNSLRITQGMLIGIAAILLVLIYSSYSSYQSFSKILNDISSASEISAIATSDSNTPVEDAMLASPTVPPTVLPASTESGMISRQFSLLNKCLLGLLVVFVILVGGIFCFAVYNRIRDKQSPFFTPNT